VTTWQGFAINGNDLGDQSGKKELRCSIKLRLNSPGLTIGGYVRKGLGMGNSAGKFDSLLKPFDILIAELFDPSKAVHPA